MKLGEGKRGISGSCLGVLSGRLFWSGVWFFAFCTVFANPVLADEYFDPHNHLNGILPFEAYADLPGYIKSFNQGITDEDYLAYYNSLLNWEKGFEAQEKGKDLNKMLYAPDQRYGLGARTVFKFISKDNDLVEIKGALERVLSATPWTEFDNAYAFRGEPTDEYLRGKFYKFDNKAESTAILEAIELELARTNIMISEQSMSFIGGWKFRDNGDSSRLDTIKFFMNPSKSQVLNEKLKKFPKVRILLMTHAAELGEEPDGKEFSYFYSQNGCGPKKMNGFTTAPFVIEEALKGNKTPNKPLFKMDSNGLKESKGGDGDLMEYWNTVVGIDTAGPEMECMNAEGMKIFKRYVHEVLNACKYRREHGWKGKLLVHTHVGEGGCVYLVVPTSFGSAYGNFPTALSNNDQTSENISVLLRAIADLEKENPKLLDYVVFRLGHVTWATKDQAKMMSDLKVEADVNLESNVSTGAYPMSRMSGLNPILIKLTSDLRDKKRNWRLNDLLGVLIPRGNEGDTDLVGRILGDAALKYLLEYHVPVMLGTDGAGVEHSDIKREYALGASLIKYWGKNDPNFPKLAGNIDAREFIKAVNWHLDNMANSEYKPFGN